MISVDTVFCTLRVKTGCSVLRSLASLTAIRIPQLRCSMLISVDITRYTLNGLLRASLSRIPHGNSHSATTLLHAHFRGHHTLRVKTGCFVLRSPASLTAIRIPQRRCFMLISVDIIRYALKRAAPCFALPHPSRQFAFRNYVAPCSFPWTS